MITDLSGKTALVTGASRGLGKAIALVLGECCAEVYATGRSSRRHGSTEDLPGTVEETAEEVTRRGGKGVPVLCDHTDMRDVEALFARIKGETGKLDILVNNIWGGYEQYDSTEFSLPFWQQKLSRWDRMFNAGVKAHFTASRLAVPLLLKSDSGLIVSISAGDRNKFLGEVIYDTAKAAIDRLAFGMTQDLKEYKITALSLYPGFTRTERVVKEAPAEALKNSDSPEYTGRVIAALAGDEKRITLTGKSIPVGELAERYNLTDIDGKYHPPFRLE